MMTPTNAMRANLGGCVIRIGLLPNNWQAYDRGTITICTKTLRVLFAYLAKSLILTACVLISPCIARANAHSCVAYHRPIVTDH
jgi:hypothetical protein